MMKNGKKTLVGSVYRSTSNTAAINKLVLDKLEKASDIVGENRLLILGDFNVPDVDWEENELKEGADQIDRQILTVKNDNFLTQHVNKPTRFRKDKSSLLDLVFTREEGDIRNIEVLQPLGSSDHGVVTGEFICEWKSKTVQKPKRMYYKGKYDKILERLKQID